MLKHARHSRKSYENPDKAQRDCGPCDCLFPFTHSEAPKRKVTLPCCLSILKLPPVVLSAEPHASKVRRSSLCSFRKPSTVRGWSNRNCLVASRSLRGYAAGPQLLQHIKHDGQRAADPSQERTEKKMGRPNPVWHSRPDSAETHSYCVFARLRARSLPAAHTSRNVVCLH